MIYSIFIFTFISFSIFLLLHIFLWKIIEGYRGVILILFISLISYIFTFIVFSRVIPIQITDNWVLVPVYCCLIMLYCHLYVGILKSVSIRILEELFESSNQTMSLEEIEELYPTKEMVTSRVNLLVSKGWLEKNELNYMCLKKAVFTVKINLFLHKVFRLNHTG